MFSSRHRQKTPGVTGLAEVASTETLSKTRSARSAAHYAASATGSGDKLTLFDAKCAFLTNCVRPKFGKAPSEAERRVDSGRS